MTHELELHIEKTAEGRIHLVAPAVGLFSQAVTKNAVLTPGAPAGVLETLGVTHRLLVPHGASGRVVNDRPERVLEPVGFGQILYELAPVEDGTGAFEVADDPAAVDLTGLAFRAPYSGRFWRRPSPGDPPFVAAGDEIGAGDTIGLLEVMKTFTHLHYAATAGLPPRARVVRLLIDDGGEVNEGEAIVEVEAV